MGREVTTTFVGEVPRTETQVSPLFALHRPLDDSPPEPGPAVRSEVAALVTLKLDAPQLNALHRALAARTEALEVEVTTKISRGFDAVFEVSLGYDAAWVVARTVATIHLGVPGHELRRLLHYALARVGTEGGGG